MGVEGKQFLNLSSSWVKIRLHTECKLSMLHISGQKVCGGGWVGVSQFQC